MKINYPEKIKCFGEVSEGTIIEDVKGRISMKIQQIEADLEEYNVVSLENGEPYWLDYTDNVTVYPDAELTL